MPDAAVRQWCEEKMPWVIQITIQNLLLEGRRQKAIAHVFAELNT